MMKMALSEYRHGTVFGRLKGKHILYVEANPTCDFWFRQFPIDMAGFAIRVELILSNPNVWMGFAESGRPSSMGYLESNFVENFATRESVECRGNNREVCVHNYIAHS